MRDFGGNLKEGSIIYCFQIIREGYEDLFLSSSDVYFEAEGKSFAPYSCLNLSEAFFNDSAKNYVIIEGIFEERGIHIRDDLSGARIKIFIYSDTRLYNFVTYYCTSFTKFDLNFKAILEPESRKYDSLLLNRYSKNCRASFGDSKCKFPKETYERKYLFRPSEGGISLLENPDREDGYYKGGEASFGEDKKIKYEIREHIGKEIELAYAKPGIISSFRNVYLTIGCDKSFITCCNKFGNEVNFRGEPFIPDVNSLKI